LGFKTQQMHRNLSVEERCGSLVSRVHRYRHSSSTELTLVRAIIPPSH
jgi:hypothetical protein